MRNGKGLITYANVMATVAVCVALGGASYAAVVLPQGSVGSAQLRAEAVTTGKIKDHAVTGAKVRLSTLGAVPEAAHAVDATHALEAQKSSEATHSLEAAKSLDADRAAVAKEAENARLLGGLESNLYGSLRC